MSEIAEPPVSQEPVSQDYSPSAIMARFNAATQPKAEEPVVETAPEPKVEKVEKPVDQGIPDAVITGKKAEIDPEEAFLNEAPKGPLKHENWARIQKAAQQYKAKAAELEAKLANPTVPESFQKDYEGIKAKLAEREAELERFAVERSPKFQELFTSKEKGITESFLSITKELEIDQDTAESLLSAKGKKRYDLIDDLDIAQSAKADLSSMLRKKDDLGKEKESFLSKSNEELGKWQEEQQAAEDSRLAKLKQHEDRIFSSKLEALTKNLAPLQKIGDEKWDAAVDANIAEAKRFFTGQITVEEAAEYAIAGATAKQVYKMFEVAQGRLQKAEEELARLKTASPSVESPGKPKPEDDSKLTLEQRAMKTFAAMAAPKNSGF